MTTLYNCKHDGDQYRITKFDEGMNVESSYLCSTDTCECPAGVRPMCRHREMLPYFVNRGAVGKGEFYDYSRGGWVQMWEDPPEGRQIKVDLDGIPTPMTDALLQPHGPAERTGDSYSSGAGSIPAVATKRSGWRRF